MIEHPHLSETMATPHRKVSIVLLLLSIAVVQETSKWVTETTEEGRVNNTGFAINEDAYSMNVNYPYIGRSNIFKDGDHHSLIQQNRAIAYMMTHYDFSPPSTPKDTVLFPV